MKRRLAIGLGVGGATLIGFTVLGAVFAPPPPAHVAKTEHHAKASTAPPPAPVAIIVPTPPPAAPAATTPPPAPRPAATTPPPPPAPATVALSPVERDVCARWSTLRPAYLTRSHTVTGNQLADWVANGSEWAAVQADDAQLLGTASKVDAGLSALQLVAGDGPDQLPADAQRAADQLTAACR